MNRRRRAGCKAQGGVGLGKVEAVSESKVTVPGNTSNFPPKAGSSESAPFDAGTSPFKGWLIFGLLSSLTTFSSVVQCTFGVMLPEIRKDIPMSMTLVGLLAAIFSLFNALLAVPINSWFSRYNPVKLVAISGVFAAVFLFLQGFAWNFASLFVARFVFVLFNALKSPARSLLLQQWLARRDIGLANAIGQVIHGGTQTLGLALASLVAVLIGGWRPTYMAMAAVMAIQVLVWSLVARQRRTEHYDRQFFAQEKTPMVAVLRYPRMWLIGLGVLAACLPWSALLTFLPTFLVESRGISLTMAGPITALLYAGSTVGWALAGVVDRWFPKRKLFVVVSSSFLVIAPLLLLNVTNIPLLMALAFLNGLGWAFWPIVQTLPFHLPGAKPREVAVMVALLQAFTGIGFGLGPLLGGVLSDIAGSLWFSLMLLAVFPIVTVASGLAFPDRAITPSQPKVVS